MDPLEFKLGRDYAYYTNHNGDMYERNQTAEERKIMADVVGALFTPQYYDMRHIRETYEIAATMRLKAFGVTEQETLKMGGDK